MKRTAVVIGGGPAGLSAALGLLGAGYATEVLESQPEWKGRVCGSFLNPDAVRNLETLGVLEKARELGSPAPVARLYGPLGAESAVFTAQDGVAGMALWRKDLEELLTEAVTTRGGTVFPGARAISYARTGSGWAVLSRDGTEEAVRETDVLVVADGRFSMAARGPKPSRGWFGYNATFTGVPQLPGTLALYFAPNGYVGTLAFADGTMNVCGLVHRTGGDGVSWPGVHAAFQKRNRAFRRLMSAGARQSSEWRGVGPLPYTLTPRREPGIILAGDAAGVGDPFMGEGIGRALGTGPLIAEAAGAGAPEELAARYARIWDECYGERFRLGWKARLLLDRPWLALGLVDLLLRPRLIERATDIFHRGAGFRAGAVPSTAP